MRREVVERRHWLEEPAFFDYFAACQLIPGPTSTELAILLGYKRAGTAGLVVAGGLFILPAMLIMLGLAWAYARVASSPVVAGALHGIRPVVVGIIAWALIDLGRRPAGFCSRALSRPHRPAGSSTKVGSGFSRWRERRGAGLDRRCRRSTGAHLVRRSANDRDRPRFACYPVAPPARLACAGTGGRGHRF